MTVATDLQAVATSIQTDVQAVLALLQNLQNGTVNADDPAVAAAVTQLQAVDASLKAVLNPPAPAPSP